MTKKTPTPKPKQYTPWRFGPACTTRSAQLSWLRYRQRGKAK